VFDLYLQVLIALLCMHTIIGAAEIND